MRRIFPRSGRSSALFRPSIAAPNETMEKNETDAPEFLRFPGGCHGERSKESGGLRLFARSQPGAHRAEGGALPHFLKCSWSILKLMLDTVAIRRAAQRGKRLEYFTIAWNSVEGLIAVFIGASAGSLSLMAFGIDSFIEVISGGILLWRLVGEANRSGREARERLALRVVGICFLALGLYVGVDAAITLLEHQTAQHSIPGIVLAIISLIVMPVLARAKRKVGARMGSAAMEADAMQTLFCVYLSAIMLAGLALNVAFGIWWADPAAALCMVPFIAREGVESLRGKHC